MTHYHNMSVTDMAVSHRDPATQPPPPPLSSLSLWVISVDIYWWWIGPICQHPILPTCITSGLLQVALTSAPLLIPGGPTSINPFRTATADQLSLGEINALSHPSCDLQLRVINASSTCVLLARSDMIMKTYALADGEADRAVRSTVGFIKLGMFTWTEFALNKFECLSAFI